MIDMTKQRMLRYLLLCISLWLSTLVHAKQNIALAQVVRGQLDNGFKYWIVPFDGVAERMDIRLLVHAGALHESTEQSGAAHMLEHMLFKSTAQYPQGLANSLQQQQWRRAQHYNAITQYERTIYMLNPPLGKQQLAQSLQVLQQMLTQAQLTQADLDAERQIVLEEWRDRLGVAERMNQQRLTALRSGSRYPERPLLGSEQAIQQLTTQHLQDYYQRWYQANNMQLLISGAVDVAQAEQLIRQYFSAIRHDPQLQQQDYDPQIRPQLRVVRLQDLESGSSQLSWVYRFDDALAHQNSPAGMRHRLLNQITLASLSAQLKRQSAQMPAAISNVLVRKADIGMHTTALGFFATVPPGEHAQALPLLLTEIARLKQHHLYAEDIAAAKAEIEQTAQQMLSKPELRSFDEWIQKIALAWQQGWEYKSSQQIASEVLAQLPTISTADINQHLQSWLAQTDQLLQYAAPGNSPLSMAQPQDIEALWAQLAAQDLADLPAAGTFKIVPALQKPKKSGKITLVEDFSAQHVRHYHLENGDQVVWLQSPLAKDNIYLTAQNQRGFLAADLDPALSQLAIQMVSQNGPQAWDAGRYRQWKAEQKLALNVSQSAQYLNLSAQAPRQQAAQLLQLWDNLQRFPSIDPSAMHNSLAALMRQQLMNQQSLSGQKQQQIQQLRFGMPDRTQAEIATLKQVSSQQLLKQWRRAVQAPMRYYLIADLPQQDIEQLLMQYLAGQPRQPAAAAPAQLPLSGDAQKIVAINHEPKADVRLWSFTEQAWQPETAVQVNIAATLAEQALKSALRDQALGVYRLKFQAELNPSLHRVESSLSFSASPARAEELTRLAQQVLADLPAQISAAQVAAQRQKFMLAEQTRSSDISHLQRRLMLSDQQYQSPKYLNQLNTLHRAIQLPAVQAAARLLLNQANLKIYTALPQSHVSE